MPYSLRPPPSIRRRRAGRSFVSSSPLGIVWSSFASKPSPKAGRPGFSPCSLEIRLSRQNSSTDIRKSSSSFWQKELMNINGTTVMRPRSVVSKATARPVVTPPRAALTSSRCSTVWMNLANPPTATLTPRTVPMNPRIGIAQAKTLTITKLDSMAAVSRSS